MRTLVIYYSRTGNTRRVANQLRALTGADLEELREASPRDGRLGWLLCIADAALRRLPALRIPKHFPANYDVVLVGGPIWMGLFAPAVRSFLCDARLRHVRIGLFATCRSTSTEAALQDAEALADRKAQGYRAFRTHLMDEAQVRSDCTQFVSDIESALARAPNRARSPVHTPGTPGGVDLPTAH